MARFLFTTLPYPGDMCCALAVAHALRACGHQIAFYTGLRVQQLVEGEGFQFMPFERAMSERIDGLMLSPDGFSKEWRYPWRRIPLMRALLWETVPQQVADLEKVLDDWHPDMIIQESVMYAPLLILHDLRQIPVVILDLSFCTLSGPEVPPIGLNLPRPHNWQTRLLARGGERLLNVAAANLRRSVSNLRQRYGLPPLEGTVVDFSRRLPLRLVPSCPEFDFDRKDLPPSVKYIGPCLWYPAAEPSEWLAEIPRGQPWVHATEGTLYAHAPRVLRAAAQGLGGLDMQVILTTGRQRPLNTIHLGPLAPNIVVKPWVSYPELLPKLDLIITMGGGTTVLAALAAGIPMVIVPTIWDQPENAQRVAAAGAGVVLSARQCTPLRVRQAVQHVLSDPTYRQNARRLAHSLQQYAGPARGAELLEELAALSRDVVRR